MPLWWATLVLATEGKTRRHFRATPGEDGRADAPEECFRFTPQFYAQCSIRRSMCEAGRFYADTAGIATVSLGLL